MTKHNSILHFTIFRNFLLIGKKWLLKRILYWNLSRICDTLKFKLKADERIWLDHEGLCCLGKISPSTNYVKQHRCFFFFLWGRSGTKKVKEAPCVLEERCACHNCFTQITEIEEQRNTEYLVTWSTRMWHHEAVVDAMGVDVCGLFHVLRTMIKT